MNFLSPAWLWGLLAVLPLIGVYFLRVRPRRRPVTAFFLWQKVLERKKASSLFQRLRDAFSLLLMLLTLIAVVFAAAGLTFKEDDQRDIVLLLDITPSMKAKSNNSGKSSYELASQQAHGMIRAMNGTRRMALATVSDELRFMSHLSESPRDLQNALMKSLPGDVPLSARCIETINQYADQPNAKHRVILLTDGHTGWDKLSKNVEVVRFATGSVTNAGIIAADMEWNSATGNKARFFYQVASSSSEETRVDLELRNEDTGSIARLIPLTIAAQGQVSDTIEIESAQAGRWTAALQTKDALSADNQAALGLPSRQPVKVKIAIKDSYFYRRCIEAFQNATGVLELSKGDSDITVTSGSVSDDPFTIVFAPRGDSPFWQNSDEDLEVLIAEPKLATHPIIKNVDCDSLRFHGAKKITPIAGALIIVASETGAPLIWKSEIAGKSAVVFNFDPADDEFFLSPWFPVLIHNAATHLADREEAPRAAFPTGAIVSLPSGATSPDGQKILQPIISLEKMGHWQAATGNWFGVALFSKDESILNGSGPVQSAVNIEKGNPPMTWLIWIALALLIAESILYHRRKVG